jgi:putative transposase
MNLPFRTKIDHRPLEWATAPVYFITICAQERGNNQLCAGAAPEILRSIGFYNEKQRWWCEYAVLMPDHMHLLVSFPEISIYQKTVGDWKRWITRQHDIEWQENFFEHRLRNDENAQAKWMYLRENPVRAGLVDKAEDWPWFWQPCA